MKPLNCPFCGRKALAWESAPRGTVVECTNFQCCAYEINEGHGAPIEEWNTRHPHIEDDNE